MTRRTATAGPAILAASLLLVACTQAPAPAPEPAQQMNAPEDLASIAKLRDGYAAAMTSGDAAAFENLYTPDGVSQTNQMATMTGRPAIVADMEKTFDQMSFSDMEIMPDETHTMGNMGFERGHYKMMVTPKAGGDPMPQMGRYMLVLEKGDDGMWRVARDMDNVEHEYFICAHRD